jgi:3-hydroxyacyl-[acyl-carrier-protein] dehydratase
MVVPRALDRVVGVEPGRGARAERNVPQTLAVFDTHFPRFPVLPGVLLVQSLEALGAHFLGTELGGTWRLTEVEQVKFRHYARPGDRLEIAVDLAERAGRSATFSGTIRVDDRIITTVRRLHFEQTDGG